MCCAEAERGHCVRVTGKFQEMARNNVVPRRWVKGQVSGDREGTLVIQVRPKSSDTDVSIVCEQHNNCLYN